MKTGYVKHVFVGILVLSIFASLILLPSVKALNFDFTDTSSFDLTISSSLSVVKSGDTVVFTVSLTLNTYLYGNAHVRIWLYDSVLVAVDLVNQDLMAAKNWTAGSSFNQPYIVVIPNGVANNNYVYATVDVDINHFSNLNIALVQTPTFAELQNQVIELRGNVTSLTTQLNTLQGNFNNLSSSYSSVWSQLVALQSNYSNLLANYNTLQGNYNNLNSSYSSVWSQLVALQSNYSNLLANYNTLQTQLSSLQINNASLQTQINSLISDKASLQSQITTLQTQLNNRSAENSDLKSQLGDLQASKASQIAILEGNNSDLRTQLSTIQTDKDELLNQINDFQVQVNALKLNSTNLQAIVTNFGAQIDRLQEDLSSAQSENGTTTVLMYLALGVAATFIIATVSIIILIFKKKKAKPDKTAEAPLS